MRRIGRAQSLLSLATATGLLAVACGSSLAPPTVGATPTATATVTAPPSPTSRPSATHGDQPVTGRIEVADRGYAVTLPDNWFRIDLDEEEIQQLVEAGSGQMSDELVEFLKSQMGSMIASGISLLAFREADSQAPVGSNANILTLASYGMSLDTLETLNMAQLKSLLGNDLKVTADRLSLPAGDALRFAYEFPMNGEGGVTMQIHQFLILTDTQQVYLSCTTPGDIAGIEDECRSIAQSIETIP